MRIGIGYDVHRLIEGRKLILGGVEIPFEKGLLGHSDADVVTHAIMDALLGAAGKGDIGRHFPDNNIQFKDVSSIYLLSVVKEILNNECYFIGNIDCVIVAQKPKLAPFLDDMVKNISNTLDIPFGQINIKATTEEGLGFTGCGDGISSHAICLISSN